jgi:hypothetical protein
MKVALLGSLMLKLMVGMFLTISSNFLISEFICLEH